MSPYVQNSEAIPNTSDAVGSPSAAFYGAALQVPYRSATGLKQANLNGSWGSTETIPLTASTYSYSYNGDGLRRAKTAPDGTTTSYTWTPGGTGASMLAETTGPNTTYTIYGPGQLPVEQILPTGTAVWLHHDQLGSTRLITDNTGTNVGSYNYDAYGNVTSTTGTVTTALQYAGQYTDPETGYQYLHARYYDPATGQFLTRDPLNTLTRSAYSYVNNNPLNFTDPTGLLFGVSWDEVKSAASDAWNSTGGKVVHAAKQGGAALGTAAVATGDFIVENRGAIATGIAIGGCLAPGVGLALCGGLAVTAFGFRAEQRIEEQGFSASLGANLADAGLTYLTFGLGGAFEAAAGESAALQFVGRLFPAGYDITALYAYLHERTGC